MIMQKMRKLAVVILWLLILAFIGWIGLELGANIVGYRVYQPWERGIIAKVGNYEITYNEYHNELQRVILDTTRKLNRELTIDEIENLRMKVFDEVVENTRWKLLLQDLKISLSPNAIIKIITLFPPPEIFNDTIFYTDGKFDYGKYAALLRDQRAIPFFVDYENRLKRDIPRDIVRYYLSVLALPSDEEAKQEFIYKNRRVKLIYVNVPANLIADTLVKTSEEEKRSYYNEIKEEFKAPERVKLIVIRAFKYPSYNDTILARDKIESIKEQIRNGENFNKMAYLFSEDLNSKADSGKIRKFLLSIFSPEIRDSFLKAKEGDIIGPILTPLGYYLYRVDRINKDTIDYSQILVKIRTSNETKKFLVDSMQNAIKSKNLSGFRVDTSAYLNLDLEFFPIVGESEELRNFLIKGKIGQYSKVFDVGNTLVAFGILDKKKKGYMDYSELKSILEARLVVKKKKELLRDTIAKVVSYLDKSDTNAIRKLLNDERVIIMETGYITADMFPPGIPFNQKEEFFTKLFKEKINKVNVFEHDLGFIVYKKLEDILPDLNQFNAQKLILRAQLYQRNFQNLISEFEREIRKKYPLESYIEHFEIN
ncbi:MAG: peptidylprolyl isomerase [candidate division WOR-3 bacterium]|nr:peptidylprolyl isomerase [candidate division WOR-3 bacterium]MCX7947899.1 peptidylprolyl isomerase [candidate division WOR-3 bacterium]MDW8150721.1 peptidylprolyl isomerase [candidate division WOR-3 bacterium]